MMAGTVCDRMQEPGTLETATMKRFLLTWYGITDLRAALGFEENGGPILAALMTREYSHVLVLAYSDPAKTGPDIERAQQRYTTKLAPALANPASEKPSRAEQTEAVDAFSNTPEGHALFRAWLHEEIRRLDLGVAIRFVPKELASLNDAKGIYDAAAEALDVVLATEGEKEVSLYLSPGTPVMAFTWAFVSLMNPELGIRAIVSPDPRQPPAQVRLPYELLDPSRRQRRPGNAVAEGGFDTVFHLFGEQRLPGLLGVLQFPSKHHVFVSSPKYPAECMRRFLPQDASFAELHVNPFDPMSTHQEILGAVAAMPGSQRVGFNLTGGTKLMFAGAQAACRKVGGVPFYFETRDHSLVFLDDFSMMEVRGVQNVETFVELNGFVVSRPGHWADNPARERRRELTRLLWRERRLIATLYQALAEVNCKPLGPFHVKREGVEASLDSEMRGHLRLGNAVQVLPGCPDFASYLCGGWLEEYAFTCLEPALKSGRLRDLRIGLEVAWPGMPNGTGRHAAQEFDVALTDGRRLFLLECKAGRVLSEDIYKLENSVRNYGGLEARGMLVAAFPPPDASRRRLEGARNLSWLDGNRVPSRLVDELLAHGKP
ncbi:hypothetical protein MFUL124B02_25825 [Myxococcus fulvus 124B02]|nr:hypothetical protein MFUL124B02_25825 [Myxococcus fulvus 124B02]